MWALVCILEDCAVTRLLMLVSFGRGWRGLWLHPLQRPLPPSRELPLSPSLFPVGGQEPQTAPFIWQNDNHRQWGLSYLTQGRLQRHFVLPWASCWPNAPVQLQREVNKVRAGGKGGVYRRIVWWRGGGIACDKPEGEEINHLYIFFHKSHEASAAERQWGTRVSMCYIRRLFGSHTRGRHASVNTVPRETSDRFTLFVAPPLAVISFYNQWMQIGIRWQPINHVFPAICWAARHMPVNLLEDVQI